MAVPSFLVIGDLKAGSTSLYSYLKQHPQVFVPAKYKELRYFAYDGENPYHRKAGTYRVKSWEEYLRFFSGAEGARAVGEASPNYLRSPCAARHIHDRLPQVKLIVCIRNPADRLHSLHQMQARSGRTRLSFEEHLFAEDATWIKGNYCFADLARYYALFPRERIHVIRFDDLAARPRDVVRSLYQFVGLDASFTPDLEHKNAGGVPRHALLYSALRRARRAARRLGGTPAFLGAAGARMQRWSLVKAPIDPATRRKILEICREDIERTQELVGLDLSLWLEALSGEHSREPRDTAARRVSTPAAAASDATSDTSIDDSGSRSVSGGRPGIVPRA